MLFDGVTLAGEGRLVHNQAVRINNQAISNDLVPCSSSSNEESVCQQPAHMSQPKHSSSRSPTTMSLLLTNLYLIITLSCCCCYLACIRTCAQQQQVPPDHATVAHQPTVYTNHSVLPLPLLLQFPAPVSSSSRSPTTTSLLRTRHVSPPRSTLTSITSFCALSLRNCRSFWKSLIAPARQQS